MTAPVSVPLLDELEAARAKATPGVWKLWGMSVMADQDGTSNVNTAVGVARTVYRDDQGKPRTFDATCIVAEHNAVPKLTAALRAVLELAEVLENEATDAFASWDTLAAREDAADRLRAAVASALGEVSR